MSLMGRFKHNQIFTIDKVKELLFMNYAIDGNLGGLILGPSHYDYNTHDESGVYFLINCGDHYKLQGEVEGFEFLCNSELTRVLKGEFFEKLNNYEQDKEDFFEEYLLPMKCRTIDARSSDRNIYNSKFIILKHPFAIINKFSTKKNLEIINEHNNKYIPFLSFK